jgi:hypothetical protein
LLKLEEMVLRDGRKLLDVWPDAVESIEANEATGFVSIPEGTDGSVFIEHGDGANRIVALYRVYRSGESDFHTGIMFGRKS